METTESKREVLKSKVAALVQDFISSEGGISIEDLMDLLGADHHPHPNRIASVLWEMPISLAPSPSVGAHKTNS
ncbi:MAG: hypothetical protein WB930_19780 [Syntrophobacteraceae bacterium]